MAICTCVRMYACVYVHVHVLKITCEITYVQTMIASCTACINSTHQKT